MTTETCELLDILDCLKFQRVHASNPPGKDYLFRVVGSLDKLMKFQAIMAETNSGANFVVGAENYINKSQRKCVTSFVGWLSGTFNQLAMLNFVASDKVPLGQRYVG